MSGLDCCWLYDKKLNEDGYARAHITRTRRTVSVHRTAYEVLVGPIPDGLELDHLCRVRHCYNPRHLEPVSHLENVRRGEPGKYLTLRTHCPHGHEYDAANTYIYQNRRHCRTCRRLATAARAAKRKAA